MPGRGLPVCPPDGAVIFCLPEIERVLAKEIEMRSVILVQKIGCERPHSRFFYFLTMFCSIVWAATGFSSRILFRVLLLGLAW